MQETGKKDLISVIIPVYNVDRYLCRAVDSVLHQATEVDREIILVDDGSTDECPRICDDYAQRYVNITVIHQVNAGVSAARNAGLQVAGGEYIAFVDSDDYMLPGMLSDLFDCIKKNKAEIAIVDFCLYYPDGVIKKKRRETGEFCWNHEEAFRDFLSGKGIGINLFDKLYRRDLIQEIKFDETVVIGEDMYWLFQVMCRVNRIAADFTKGQYIYTIRKGSAMKKKFSEQYFDSVRLSEKMLTEVREHYPKYLPYAKAHLVHEQIKTVERMVLGQGQEQYRKEYRSFLHDIRKYRLRDAYRYLSRKQFFGLLLIKISIWLYVRVLVILRI